MNVYISSDIEGVGCVVRPEHSTIQGREYLQSRRFMTEEVNAAIRGAFDAGAERVMVSDSHNVGLNLLPEELDPRAELVMGSPRPMSMMWGVDQAFDLAFFVGYHGKPGTTNANIAHNFHGRILNVTFNGQSLGELGMNAALAGVFNVPVVLVTGDEVTCREAEALLPGVATVSVKKGIGAYAAQCIHPHLCRQRIYDAALNAVRQGKSVQPFRVEEPLVMEMEVTTASTADRLERIPGFHRTGPTTMRSDRMDVLTAHNLFMTAADLVDMVPFI